MQIILDHGPLFNEEDLVYIENLLFGLEAKWCYAGHSNNIENERFWYFNLEDYDFFYNFSSNKIKEVANISYGLSRVYANGQTVNQSGDWHIDHDYGMTCLWYFNTFEDDWGGKTQFKLNGNIYNYTPKRNHLVSFPSNILHKSQAPTNKFNSLRITIAWKFNNDSNKM